MTLETLSSVERAGAPPIGSVAPHAGGTPPLANNEAALCLAGWGSEAAGAVIPEAHSRRVTLVPACIVAINAHPDSRSSRCAGLPATQHSRLNQRPAGADLGDDAPALRELEEHQEVREQHIVHEAPAGHISPSRSPSMLLGGRAISTCAHTNTPSCGVSFAPSCRSNPTIRDLDLWSWLPGLRAPTPAKKVSMSRSTRALPSAPVP
eukprot:CAMPEP_0117673216 /NCGR_PEP_ID=MMETSP0804-20121206/14349_1 /TAXON_ID=1074897 /ORGANISM="Tetraselmis astigmatica, Strain CCMP880" /LENGTH=206 /DNA_ID=CAMNT_0005481929 /DNA_START=339 /DNA_END=961 /DNA_ORIENTATION=-